MDWVYNFMGVLEWLYKSYGNQ